MSFKDRKELMSVGGKSPTLSRSLVSLAATNSLPLFQYMDAETCQWIERNNPGLTQQIPDKVSRLYIEQTLVPKREWFAEPRIIDSLHGMRHLLRCSMYAMFWAISNDLEERMKQLLVTAAVLHDIRRFDDKADPDHGSRSAEWFLTNCSEVLETFSLDLSQDEQEAVAVAMELHETPYLAFSEYQARDHKRHPTLVDVMKLVDALDRFRLPKLKWWIDETHLRLTPEPWMKQLAYMAVLQSEKQFLATGDNALKFKFTKES